MTEAETSVRVALRVRPAVIGADPTRAIPRTCLQIIPGEPQVVVGVGQDSTKKSFTYDYVYGPNDSQERIYNDLAKPLISKFLEGFNTSLLA
ncbi:Chromosome-associated kinesin kif4a [Boothiomyces sp. JEL0866]|nr:Chromosome-associated kinesin kif4a [Boothiomyces sp. JEL0866]KAJ3319469.1 Chromosome-associated kinesin kif4a [Boothiomyces sp. JEL0866]